MKTCLSFFMFFYVVLLHGQTRDIKTDSVVVCNRGWEFEHFNFPPTGKLRGANYILKGYIYPGYYLDKNCPDSFNCGIDTAGFVILDDGSVIYLGKPSDDTLVIGEWDCRGLWASNFEDLENGGTVDHSTQTYQLYANKQKICPDGCTIVTEGPVNVASFFGTDPNIKYRRTIAGGTNQLKFIRGDVEHLIYFKHNQGNGFGTNHKTIFHFAVEDKKLPTLQQLDVSTKRQTLIIDGPVDSAGNPQYGAALVLEGVIYRGGTFAQYGANIGIDSAGNASFDSIGTWTARGWWNSKDKTFEDGFFAATQQIFEFTDDVLGHLQIMTEGWDQADAGPNKRLVVSATDALSGHRGDCDQAIVGKNSSGGFNFTYTLETQKLVGLKSPFEKNPLALNLFPNPSAGWSTLSVSDVRKPGSYALEIIDAAGRIFVQRNISLSADAATIPLDLSGLSQGWHVLSLKKDGFLAGSKRFLKLNH